MRVVDAEHYLVGVELLKDRVPAFESYPFSLPAIRYLNRLAMHPQVTFVIGENATGKSTLLGAVAVACGLNPEGGSKNFHFSTRESHSSLHDYLRLTWGPRRPRDSYFLRTESFYNLGTEIERLGAKVMASYGGVLCMSSLTEKLSSLRSRRGSAAVGFISLTSQRRRSRPSGKWFFFDHA